VNGGPSTIPIRRESRHHESAQLWGRILLRGGALSSAGQAHHERDLPLPTRMTEHLLETVEDEMRALSPFGRLGRDGELKGVAVFLCSAASDWITGQVIHSEGGFLRA